jgi:predicted enzyme related to lactoylglutathione lyase
VIDKIVGITVWTEDLLKLKNFYHQVLKLPLHSHHQEFVVFKWGEMRLNIGLHDRVRGMNHDPFRIMIHLRTDNILKETNRLLSLGVEFIRLPEKESWGGWVGTFKDPDDNVLQLLQLPRTGPAKKC